MRFVCVLIAFVVVLGALFAVPANAFDFDQKQFYGQGVFALPIGDFGDLAKFGFGAGLGLVVPHNEELSFRGEASFLYYLDDIEEPVGVDVDPDVTLWQVPVQFFAQYTFPESQFYGLAGLGLTFTHVDWGTDTIGGISAESSNTETDVALSFGGGFQIDEKMGIEGRFNIISDANSISAHFGYRF